MNYCRRQLRVRQLGYRQLGDTQLGYRQLGDTQLGYRQLGDTQLGYRQLGDTQLGVKRLAATSMRRFGEESHTDGTTASLGDDSGKKRCPLFPGSDLGNGADGGRTSTGPAAEGTAFE